MNKPVPKNWSEIKKIRLTPDAKKLWIAEHDRIEQLCAPGNELEGYEGLASKYGEQIAVFPVSFVLLKTRKIKLHQQQ